jgi:Na+-driven multidrug efflux pump
MGLGAPAAIEQVAVSAGFLVLTVAVARLGTDSLAAQRIVGNLLGMSLLPGFGFGIAATALVGQSLGAGNPDEGEHATGIATQWALIWMGTLGIVFILLRSPLVAIFTDDPAVGRIAAACMVPLGITQPLWAISFVISGGLRGAGNTRFPLLMTIVSIWGTVLFGMTVIVAAGAGLAFVWGGFLIFSPLAAYLTGRRFRRGDWKAIVLLAEQPVAAPVPGS